MSKFQEFKEAFDEKFDGDIYEFIDKTEYGDDPLPFGGKLIENLDHEFYDSYGSEDSQLERIFYFEEFDVYVSFEGTRQSYSGTDWNGFREVKQASKTIQTWEKI